MYLKNKNGTYDKDKIKDSFSEMIKKLMNQPRLNYHY